MTKRGCVSSRTPISTPGTRRSTAAARPSEAVAELSEKFPQYAELISAWSDRFGETISGPVPGVHDLVEELDERGVPLFAITNFSADFWAPFRAREAAFFDRFRDIVVSGEEKLLKPDPAIYFLALDRFQLGPAEALFVDDRAINVEAAEAIGMKAHSSSVRRIWSRLIAEGLLA